MIAVKPRTVAPSGLLALCAATMPAIAVKRRSVALSALLVLCAAAMPAMLAASTTVPPPFDWVNRLISYIRSAAIPFTVLMLMICAIAWVPAKNGEGIVAFGGRALLALSVILGGAVLLTTIGFQGSML